MPQDFSWKTTDGLWLSTVVGYKNTATGIVDDWYFIPGIESMHLAFIFKMNKAPNYYGIPEIIFKARNGTEAKVIEESGTDTNHVFIIPLLVTRLCHKID